SSTSGGSAAVQKSPSSAAAVFPQVSKDATVAAPPEQTFDVLDEEEGLILQSIPWDDGFDVLEDKVESPLLKGNEEQSPVPVLDAAAGLDVQDDDTELITPLSIADVNRPVVTSGPRTLFVTLLEVVRGTDGYKKCQTPARDWNSF
ncbi:hypothetical protein BGZ70_003801, partial [Mortierella alpina]